LLVLFLVLLVAASALVAGCGSDAEAVQTSATVASSTTTAPPTTAAQSTTTTAAAFPVTITDDNGNAVTVKAEPRRIVSTAPASTETLFALGVGDRVVGVTSLCDYPPEVAGIAKIGDFQANTEAVMALSPDLVVGYSGNEEALAPVQAAGAPVIILNPASIDGIYANITALGAATGATAKATELVESIKAQIEEVTAATAAAGEKPRVFYALDNTLWTCGPGSFVDELLALVNAVNVGSENAGEGAQPYYQLSPEQLIAADPDIILLPNTAYTSVDTFVADARFASLSAVKNGKVILIDDVIITRPGARIGQGVKILAEAVHPGVF
jgi:iron complex transport system substrate-binding protein